MVRSAIGTNCGAPSLTVICTVLLAVSAPSSAKRRRTYVPGAAKVAVVAGAAGFPKTTPETGPETRLHVVVSLPGGLGRPSSVAVPASVAGAGSVMVWFTPAFTTGG